MRKDKNMFWGLMITTIGLTILVEVVFKIHIPLFKILFALFIIYWGVKILLNSFGVNDFSIHHDDHTTVFAQANRAEESLGAEHSVIFGKASFDFRKLSLEQKKSFSLNSVFAQTEIFVPKDVVLKINSNTALGEVRLPGGNATFLGQMNYQSPNFSNDRPFLELNLQTVFSKTTVSYEDTHND